MKEAKKAFRQELAICVCCEDATLEDLGFPAKDGKGDSPVGGEGGGRGLRQGGGGKGKGKGTGKGMQDKIDEKCDSGEITCPEDPSSLDCDSLEKPGKPEFTGDETKEEWLAIWTAMKEAKKAFRQELAICVCCKDATLEELGFPAKDGKGVRPVGGKGGGRA